MTSLQRHRLLTSVLLLLPLMMQASSSSSEEIANNVSRLRDNSLMRFSSKITSSVVKDPKSGRHETADVGSSGPADRAKVLPASWTPACRNDSCPSPGSNAVVQGPGRARRPDRHPTAADNEWHDVIDLMMSVSEEVSSLRSALQHLKLDSQALHRQIKRLHRSSCSTAKRARRRTKWTGSDEQNKRLPDTGRPLR